MKRIRWRIWVVASLLVLIAYEGNTTKEWMIENNTDQELSVRKALTIDMKSADVMLVASGTSERIAAYDLLGGNKDVCSPPETIADFQVTSASGNSLTKTIQ